MHFFSAVYNREAHYSWPRKKFEWALYSVCPLHYLVVQESFIYYIYVHTNIFVVFVKPNFGLKIRVELGRVGPEGKKMGPIGSSWPQIEFKFGFNPIMYLIISIWTRSKSNAKWRTYIVFFYDLRIHNHMYVCTYMFFKVINETTHH